MAEGTDNTGSDGRFGARYGVRIRRRIRDIEERQRDDHLCPGCGHEKVDRVAAGVWQCEKCGHKFAGGAYEPETPGRKATERQLREALTDEGETDETGPGGPVLDESETATPSPGGGPAAGPETDEVPEVDTEAETPETPEAPEAEEEDEADEEPTFDEDIPEVGDVPELDEDVPELDEDVPEIEDLDTDFGDEETDDEEADGDDDVVPEADLDPDERED